MTHMRQKNNEASMCLKKNFFKNVCFRGWIFWIIHGLSKISTGLSGYFGLSMDYPKYPQDILDFLDYPKYPRYPTILPKLKKWLNF